MTATQEIPWKRLSIEAAAIVISILLAFAIDAWWDDRQERINERETLLGLKTEYQDHRSVLVVHIERHLLQIRSILDLMSASQRGTWASDEFTIDFTINNLLSPNTTDLGAGVLDSLISAGKIELLSDRLLRYELAEWKSKLEELNDDQLHAADIIKFVIIPYMTRQGVPLGGITTDNQNPMSAFARSLAADTDAMQRLFSDAEFRSMLEIRHGFMLHAIGEFDNAIAAADSILARIDSSLAH